MKSSKETPEHGDGNYKFEPTIVKDAKEDTGACLKAADVQIGLNKSRLPKASAPEGSTLKDGEKQEYAEGLFGTP